MNKSVHFFKKNYLNYYEHTKYPIRARISLFVGLAFFLTKFGSPQYFSFPGPLTFGFKIFSVGEPKTTEEGAEQFARLFPEEIFSCCLPEDSDINCL